jgi:hypothetical protein
MTSGDGGSGGTSDPTRGSGPDTTTEAVAPDLDAPAGVQKNEPGGSLEPDPAGGGCLKYGWGCLPMFAGLLVLVPAGIIY